MAASARAVGTGEILTDDVYYAPGVIVMNDWIVQTPLFGGMGAVHAYLPS